MPRRLSTMDQIIPALLLFAAVALGLSIGILEAFADDVAELMCLILIVLTVPVWGTALLCLFGWALWRRRWLLAALLPVACIVSLPLAIIALIPGETVGDYCRLFIMYPRYEKAIAEQTGNGPPKRITFDWGSTGWALDATDYTLIYDPAEPKTEDGGSFSSDDGSSQTVTHLWGRFYLEAVETL